MRLKLLLPIFLFVVVPFAHGEQKIPDETVDPFRVIYSKFTDNDTELYARALARGKAWRDLEEYEKDDIVAVDGVVYVSKSNGNVGYLVTDTVWWTVLPGGGGILHAPSDGHYYSSRNGDWVRGDYTDLLNLPTIPTDNTQLINGAGYLSGYIESDPFFVAWDKDYNDLINRPSYEPAAGNPLVNGYVWSSLTDGTRAWIEMPSGGTGISHATSDGNSYASRDGGWVRIDYSNLLNLPTIPTNNNELTNGAGYLDSFTELDPFFATLGTAAMLDAGSDIDDLVQLQGACTDSNYSDQTACEGAGEQWVATLNLICDPDAEPCDTKQDLLSAFDIQTRIAASTASAINTVQWTFNESEMTTVRTTPTGYNIYEVPVASSWTSGEIVCEGQNDTGTANGLLGIVDEAFTANHGVAVALANNTLQASSVVVTTIDGLTTYTETTDYTIDYPAGTISTIQTTADIIDEGFTSSFDVAVALINQNLEVAIVVTSTDGLTTYNSGTDYTSDSVAGTITVVSTGTMLDATNYLVDYTYTTGIIDGSNYAIDYTSAVSDYGDLVDSTQSWAESELVGIVVDNTTDGSACTITANTSTTATCVLTGGTDNDWDVSDTYLLYNSTAELQITIGYSSSSDGTFTEYNTTIGTEGAISVIGWDANHPVAAGDNLAAWVSAASIGNSEWCKLVFYMESN